MQFETQFKTLGPLFPKKECLRINRLTSKCDSLSEQKFQELTSQIPSKCCQYFYLIVGIISVVEEPYLCLVQNRQSVGTFMDDKVYQVKDVKFIPFKYKNLYASTDQSDCQKILQGIRSQIINDNFYFCYKQDITLNYDKRKMNKKLVTERKYFWNEDLLKIFARHKLPLCWRIPIMQGYIAQIYCENNLFNFYYLNVSRRSKFMAGTRFNSRGIDQHFNAANFVQTQEIFMCHNLLFSHISLRGSVPIFWQQSGFGSQIRFSKQKQLQNEMIIQKHYQSLSNEYNSEIITVNLLSKVKSPDKQLKNRFEFYYYKIIKGNYLYFDLNQDIKGDVNQNKIVQNFVKLNQNLLMGQNNFFCLERKNQKIICRQKTVPRISCLDCLDRTNVMMARISQLYLQQICKFINSHTNSPQKKLVLTNQFMNSLLTVWAALGNQISRIYCGTESVTSHLTKKQNNTFFSFLSTGLKSINRYYNANMNDGAKQECIDYLLGKKEQKSSSTTYFQDNISSQILQQSKYCSYEQYGIYIITWNCNMIDPQSLGQKDVNLMFNFPRESADIVVICLQEMVELNSYNVILGNNQSIVEKWKRVLFSCINSCDGNNVIGKMSKVKRYDYLTSHDLVGIAMFVFINAEIKQRINSIEWFQIKTGFKGSLGNKGMIMLFMIIDSTYITIMNCHLAAGETKSSQRLQDIKYLHEQAIKDRRLRRYFTISEFKYFIGDFNFRMQSKNQTVRQLLYSIQKQDHQSRLNYNQLSIMLKSLLAKDEFNLNRHTQPLSSYNQAQICFLPTYKYIKKQTRYDGKRTPSWCDRILFYRKDKMKLTVLKYSDLDIYLSDHKPVCGIFRFLCKKEDKEEKKKLIQAYYQS